MASVEAVGVRRPGGGALRAVLLLPGCVTDVHDHGGGCEPHLPAEPPGAVAPLQVLDVHEEALVQAADALDRVAAEQPGGADRPVDLALAVVLPRSVQCPALGPCVLQPQCARAR